jgi:Helicase associated domain
LFKKTEDGTEWDGNVPANYRTMDNPPRALGRWINRQRSAYGKDKLKKEYVDKLNTIGLKWSVHERRPGTYPDTPGSAVISAPSSGTDSSPVPNQIPSGAVVPVTNGVAVASDKQSAALSSTASSSSSRSSCSESSKEDPSSGKCAVLPTVAEETATNQNTGEESTVGPAETAAK